MKKRSIVLAMGIVLILSMILAASVSAADSVGNVVTDCVSAHFWGTVAENELGRLEVRLHDTSDWQSPILQDDYIVIAPGNFDVTVPWVANPDGRLYRAVLTYSTDGGQTWTRIVGDEGIKTCPPPPPPGGEFCSPGYFKRHLDAWGPTGYSTGDDFDTVFGVDYFNPDITLLDAVNLNGGGVKALARTGTASLLSAAHPAVNYPLTEAEVIAAVQAGDKALLDQYIDLYCPID